MTETQTPTKANTDAIRTAITNQSCEDLSFTDERVRDADIDCHDGIYRIFVHVPISELDMDTLNPGDDPERTGEPQSLADALGVSGPHSELVNALSPLMPQSKKAIAMHLKDSMVCAHQIDDFATFSLFLSDGDVTPLD